MKEMMKTRLQWWERLNRAIFPYMGPAQLGPYGEPDTPVGPKPCPICGQRMDLHEFERGEGRTATRVFCP